ncbi:MAG: ABC transporter permease [Thermodesulfobacteriota bacterium]
MRTTDLLRTALRALLRHRSRSAMMLIAMAIGVAAVVTLTSLGEAARRYVSSEFMALGTHLLIVLPGRTETAGAGPSMFLGETPRDLTLGDAIALSRSPCVEKVAPLVIGTAVASAGSLEREVPILGSTAELLELRRWRMAQGRFLPPGDPERGANVCVIGPKVRRELFGPRHALGEWLRIGDRRCRVVGVLATSGRSIGMDVEELVILPVATAQQLLDAPSLFRILVETRSRDALPHAQREIVDILRERHQGEEDVTVISQDAVLETFDRILRSLTYTLAGVAGVSLAVAGILIMNVMLVAVSQRTPEIGLLKALGAPRRQILTSFLTEAALLSSLGAALGLCVGWAGSAAIGAMYPALPLGAPWWAVVAAFTIALVTGLLFGALPARRAARLDPVQALSRR